MLVKIRRMQLHQLQGLVLRGYAFPSERSQTVYTPEATCISCRYDEVVHVLKLMGTDQLQLHLLHLITVNKTENLPEATCLYNERPSIALLGAPLHDKVA